VGNARFNLVKRREAGGDAEDQHLQLSPLLETYILWHNDNGNDTMTMAMAMVPCEVNPPHTNMFSFFLNEYAFFCVF